MEKNRLIIILFFLLVITPFLSSEVLNIDSCQNFSVEDSYYTINVSSLYTLNTCFEVQANNVTIDCNGSIITYGEGNTTYAPAINSSDVNYTTIKNCIINQSNNASTQRQYPISFTKSNNGSIYNNTIFTSTQFSYMRLTQSAYLNISFNDINTSGVNSHGVGLLTKSQNCTIYNNSINTSGTSSAGIYTDATSEKNFIGFNNANCLYAASDFYGCFILYSDNNTIRFNKINSTGANGGTYSLRLDTGSINNTVSENLIYSQGYNKFGIVATTSPNYISNNIIIRNGSSGGGIYVSGTAGDTIIDNNNVTVFGNGSWGITSYGDTSYNNITNNNIRTYGTSSYGTLIRGSNYSNIINNSIKTTGWDSDGIYLYKAAYVNVSNNRVNTSKVDAIDIYGEIIDDFNISLDQTNLANGFPVNYTFNKENTVWADLNYTGFGEVIYTWSSNISIVNVSFSNQGMYLAKVSGSLICNNTFNSTEGSGIYFYPFNDNNTILNNTINVNSNTLANIFLLSSGNNTFINNTMNNYGSYGYLLSVQGTNSFNNSFIRNSFFGWGMDTTGFAFNSNNSKSHVYMNKNVIYMNNSYAFFLEDNSNFEIIDNIFHSNNSLYSEIFIERGIYKSIINITNLTDFYGNSINVMHNSSSNYSLILNWYGLVYTNPAVSRVSIINRLGSTIFSSDSDGSGYTPTLTLNEYEYINGTNTYSTPYTISISKSGYDSKSYSINISDLKNFVLNVNLVSVAYVIDSFGIAGYTLLRMIIPLTLLLIVIGYVVIRRFELSVKEMLILGILIVVCITLVQYSINGLS